MGTPLGGDDTATTEDTINIDAAAAARRGVESYTQKVRIGGRVIEVVTVLPFAAIDEIVSEGENADVSKFASRVCPDSEEAEHLANVLGPQHLLAMFEKVWGMDPEALGVQSPPSAPTGPPSKRTSNGSTRSTSRKPAGARGATRG